MPSVSQPEGPPGEVVESSDSETSSDGVPLPDADVQVQMGLQELDPVWPADLPLDFDLDNYVPF